MDLAGLRLLLRVVEAGSVQRAALQLGLPRSTVRRRLDALEGEVGAALLVRSAKGVRLTPAGCVVRDEGRVLLERYGRMVVSAQAHREDTEGRVLVVVPVGMPDRARLALVRALHAIAPGICLQEVERPEPLDHVHEAFDLLFHFGEPPTDGPWCSRTMSRFRMELLAASSYVEEHGAPNSVTELARHRLLTWQVGRVDPRVWPLREGGQIAIEPVFCSRNGQLMHQAAQDGFGILLGNPDPLGLPGPEPLIPLLDGAVAREMTFRCLTVMPGERNPRTRAVLQSIDRFLASVAPPA